MEGNLDSNIKIKTSIPYIFIYSPILTFPIFIIFEILILYANFNSILIQILTAAYFIFIIPVYPLIFNVTNVQKLFCEIPKKITQMVIGNICIFIFYAIINRVFIGTFSALNIFLVSIIIFMVSFFIEVVGFIKKNALANESINFKHFISSLLKNERDNSSKVKLPNNFILFIVFLITIGVLVVVRFPSLFGDDPWFHSAITQSLTELGNFSGAELYHSLFGLYALGSFFQLVSGLDILVISQWYPVFSILMAGLLGFSFVKWFIKNDQIAIIGGILFIITPLDSSLAFGQYWPTSLALICGLGNFLFSIELNNKTLKTWIFYILFFISGTNIFFIHDFTAFLLFGGYIFIYLVQSFRNLKPNLLQIGYYLLSLGLAIAIRLIGSMGIFSENLVDVFSFNPILWLVLLPGAGFVIYIVQKILKAPFNDEKKYLEHLSITMKNTIALLFGSKIMKITIIASIIVGGSMIIVLPRFFAFAQLDVPQMAFNVLLIVIICTFSLIGSFMYRKKDVKTDVYFLWIAFFTMIIVGFVGLDILILHYYWWVRISIIGAGIISTGFCSYLAIHYYKQTLLTNNGKRLTAVFFMCLFLNYGLYQCANQWYKTDSELTFASSFVDNIPSNDSLVYNNFRWGFIFKYYSNFDIVENTTYRYLLKIDEHFNSTHDNQLLRAQNDMKKNNSYLILDPQQLSLGILGSSEVNYGKLTEQDLEDYIDLSYLNRVISMKVMDQRFALVYWLNLK